MYKPLFNDFLTGDDTLRVYEDSSLLFSSYKDGLLPLLEYIDGAALSHNEVVVFDKIMGNAAALLSIKAGCREVYSPLGSQYAVQTLEKHGIKYTIVEVIPYILQDNGVDMCPMEKLSLDKGPEEFFRAVTSTIKQEDG
ncbi:DUF1893 domain-containing protein [Chloroflexota bacterium]